MKSIASAPGKIILFGEHFVVHGTKAILAAIDKRVTVTTTITEKNSLRINSQLGTFEVQYHSHRRTDDSLEYRRQQAEYPERFTKSNSSMLGGRQSIKNEFMPFVYLVAKLYDWTQTKFKLVEDRYPDGLEITIDSDIPVGVGLGSSSACCVAAAASLCALFRTLQGDGFDPTKHCKGEFNEDETWEILKLAKEAERTIFPQASGADCTVCTYGGMIEYTKDKFGNPGGDTKKIDNTFDLNLLIANSMIPHNTKNSVEKVNKFKESDGERFSQLCDLETKLIDEVIVVMKNNDAAAFGLKMSENQKYLEEIQVSNDTLRGMISSLNEISLGAKITGAGDGGCVIALVKDENMDKAPALLPKDKECFSAKIDTKGVVWKIEK